MNPEPLVSIIIPTFNRANLLTETLDSVISQTYQNWECIIVDDGSSDGTESVVEKFTLKDERVKYFKRPETYKSGGNGARNYGLNLAKGEFLNWFDSDDIMLPNFIKDKITVTNFEKYELIIASNHIVTENLDILKTINLQSKFSLIKDYILWRENFQIGTPNVMFKVSFLQQNNFRFNEEIKRGQETELFRRIFIKEYINYCIVNKPGFLYRQHSNTKSKHNLVFNEEFRKNTIDISFDGLRNTEHLKDKEIKLHFFNRIFEILLLTKKESKNIYFYTIRQFKNFFTNTFISIIVLAFLNLFYFIPSSKRIDYYVGKILKKLLIHL